MQGILAAVNRLHQLWRYAVIVIHQRLPLQRPKQVFIPEAAESRENFTWFRRATTDRERQSDHPSGGLPGAQPSCTPNGAMSIIFCTSSVHTNRTVSFRTVGGTGPNIKEKPGLMVVGFSQRSKLRCYLLSITGVFIEVVNSPQLRSALFPSQEGIYLYMPIL